jgi:hypothetical protein
VDVHPRHPQIKRWYFKNPVHCATDFVSDGNSLLLRLFLGMFFNCPKIICFLWRRNSLVMALGFSIEGPKSFQESQELQVDYDSLYFPPQEMQGALPG